MLMSEMLNLMATGGLGLLPFESEILQKRGILPVASAIQRMMVDHQIQLNPYFVSNAALAHGFGVIRVLFTFTFRVLNFVTWVVEEFLVYWSYSPFSLGFLALGMYLLLPIALYIPSVLLEGEGDWEECLTSLETKRKIRRDIEKENQKAPSKI